MYIARSHGVTRYGMARRSRTADESTTGTQFSVNRKTYFHIKVAARVRTRASALDSRDSRSVKPSFPPPPPRRRRCGCRTLTTIPFQLGEPAVPVPFSSLGRPVQVAVNTVKGWGKTPTEPGVPFPWPPRCRIGRAQRVATGNLYGERNREWLAGMKGDRVALASGYGFSFRKYTRARTHTYTACLKSLFAIIVRFVLRTLYWADAREIVLQYGDRRDMRNLQLFCSLHILENSMRVKLNRMDCICFVCNIISCKD